MSSNELSLLWRLRADASQGKVAVAETRTAVAQLRQTLGPELTQSVTVANQAFSSIADNLNVFVGQRIPLVGGAFIRVTENLRGFGNEAQKQEAAIRRVSDSITDLSSKTGKSVPELTRFLTQFAKIEGQANRDAAALKFFGAEAIANNQKLIPAAEQAAAGLSRVAAQSTVASTGLASIAGPAAIAVVGILATAVAAGLLAKTLFGLAQASSEVEGKLFDLSQQTGVNVETLSALEVLAKTTGGDVSNLTQSLTAFQRVLEAAQDPTSKQATLLRRLGIDATDTESALRQTLAALARMPEGFSQTNAAAELFGARGGKQFLAILKESKGDLDGTIERLREMGILISEADAKAADEFNDQLALLQFQLRVVGAVIGREIVPIALEALRNLSTAIKDNRENIDAVAGAAAVLARVFTNPLKGALIVVTAAWESAKPMILAIQEAYEAIAAAALVISGHPILPTTRRTPTETREEPPAKDAESEVRRKLQSQLQAQRELLAAQTAFFEQEKTLAGNRIALAEREFNEGRRTQREKLSETIAANRSLRDADLAQLAFKRSALVTEAALATDDLKRRTELEAEIVAIDQKAKDRRAQFDQEVADLRSAQRVKERDDEIAHQESLLEVRTRFDAARIAGIEAEVRTGKKVVLDGDREIAEIQLSVLNRTQAFLVRKLEIIGREPSLRRAVTTEIKLIEADRTLLLRQQEDRRTDIIRQSLETQKQIQLSQISSLLEVERIRGESTIAIIRSLADARVITEEDTARRIRQIRLDLIDDELRATQARLQATGSIADVNEQARTREELNARIRVLTAERTAIESQGERDIEEGRQRDLANERRYADELLSLRREVISIQREAAQEAISLMIIHHARRSDILRAQTELDLKEAEDRHKREREIIDQEQRDNDERIRVLDKFIEALKAAGKETSDEYKKAIEERIKALEKQKELNDLEIAELERLRLEKKRITDQGKQDEAEESSIGRALESLRSGQIPELKNGVQEFADVATVALGSVFAAIGQLSQGVGQLVNQWVLMGTVGPNAFRKLAATILASVAQQAAVLAIMSLAYAALATTGVGAILLGGTPAQFLAAAALFGAVAAVTAIAGRAVAGGAFQQQAAGGGFTGGGRQSNSSNEVSPIDLVRNRNEPQVIILHIESNDSHIVRVVEEDVSRNGNLRQLIIRESEA